MDKITKFISKQINVTKYHGKAFTINEVTLPEITENQVVIKVHYVPLIHYDIMKMSGVTNAALPYVPCVELSGIIEDSFDKSLIGKKVSYMTLKHGTLQSRIIANLEEVLILKDDYDLVKGCIMSCNPFTAVGVYDTAVRQGNKKAFAVTTGNSNVGIQINKIAEEMGMKCISIVRSQSRVDEMKKIGQKYVVDSSKEDFVHTLNSLMTELEADIIFDALSGPIVGKLMKALPKYGKLINFGTQTHLPMSDIDATDFRWGFKTMSSFLVGPWIDEKIKDKSFNGIKKFINDHAEIFESESGKVYPVDKLDEAVEYAETKNDSLKVILDLTLL